MSAYTSEGIYGKCKRALNRKTVIEDRRASRNEVEFKRLKTCISWPSGWRRKEPKVPSSSFEAAVDFSVIPKQYKFTHSCHDNLQCRAKSERGLDDECRRLHESTERSSILSAGVA